MATVAPAAASLRAVASPIPKDAPVTSTVAPATVRRRRSTSDTRGGFTSLSMTFAAGFIACEFPGSLWLNQVAQARPFSAKIDEADDD
jgi:hypothetical protein